jgi:hypothetical protein
MRSLRSFALLLAITLAPTAAAARDARGDARGDAHVVAVKATRAANGTWRFDVTIRSTETGWKKYADRWQVVAPDGRVLATRVLLHPHVDEQPFTRSLDGVRIPAGIGKVTVRARDSVNGGKTVTVILRK